MDIHTLRMSTLLYKYTKNMVPGLFNNIFNPISERAINIRTWTNVFFSVSKQKNKYGQLMLNNYCYKLWQSTPLYVKNSSSFYMFKKEQKCLLLANYCHWIYFVYMAWNIVPSLTVYNHFPNLFETISHNVILSVSPVGKQLLNGFDLLSHLITHHQKPTTTQIWVLAW